MSIPLVQNNEKDSINTSIIAIKRNIERINMLLGLSNSEEIDTSKFATKDELQQAVTDLQPINEVAVDNMQSVSSNAVAVRFSELNYSVNEINTGLKWLDGKSIYKISYSGVVSDIRNNIDIALSSLLADKNVDTIIKMYGSIYFVNNNLIEPMPSRWIRFYYNTTDKNIYLGNYLSSSTTNNIVTFVVKYTKTTD